MSFQVASRRVIPLLRLRPFDASRGEFVTPAGEDPPPSLLFTSVATPAGSTTRGDRPFPSFTLFLQQQEGVPSPLFLSISTPVGGYPLLPLVHICFDASR